MEKVNCLDNLLRNLLVPAVTENESDEKFCSIDDVLSMVIKTTYDKISTDPALSWVKDSLNNPSSSHEDFQNASNTPSWKFAALCLEIMLLLRETLDAGNNLTSTCESVHDKCETLLLSVRQQKTIEMCLQLVVGFGICPYLLPGVGVPFAKRSSLATILSKTCAKDVDSRCLLLSTQALLKCCANTTLATAITSKHLSDLFAALFQLCYLPHSNLPERQILREQLDGLITRCYQPLVVRELLVLKGTPSPNSQNVPTAPPWLHKALKPILCRLVMRKGGVIATILGILDVSSSVGVTQGLDSADWKKIEAVAKLIVMNPFKADRKGEYYEAVCPQIYDLLSGKESSNCSYFQYVACRASVILADTDLNSAQMYIFSRLMRPLYFCCSEGVSDGVFYSEDEITFCIETLHRIFACGPSPAAKLFSVLTPVVCPMFNMYNFVRTGISHLKTCLEEILVTYLRNVSEDYALSVTRSLAFGEAAANLLNSWNPNVLQRFGPKGGIEIASQNDHMENISTEDKDGRRIESILSLFQVLGRDKLSVKFFFSLLEDLTHTLGSMDEVEDHPAPSMASSFQLLYIEEQSARKERFLWRSLIVVQLLSAFCEDERLQTALITDGVAIVNLIKATLERIAAVCGQQDAEMLMQSESVTLTIAIATILISPKTTKEVYSALKSCFPALKKLGKIHPDESVKAMALELCAAIATHGAAKFNDKSHEMFKKIRDDHNKRDSSFAAARSSKFQEAWDNYCDPLLPVQGHGLLALSKLLKARDAETLAHREKLLEVFQKCLGHEDSYIYLMAIQGLVALTDAFPDTVVTILALEYADFENAQRKVERTAEMRMKLGEALMKMPQLLGEMLPKYRDVLMNAFLCASRDPDPLVRASSLSNIGEMCKYLQFSISSHICEIFNCSSACVKYDKSVEVRRAAVLVVTLLLRGLGKNTLQVVDDTLKELYRILKHVFITDKDDVVKLHVQLALEELDLIMREFLFPKQSLTKKVSVLYHE